MAVDRQQATEQLRSLVKDEHGLYIGDPIDERILSTYLQFSDFNVEKAFERMKQVYKLKKKHSEFYAFFRDPSLHDVIMKKGIHMILDSRDQLGRRIYLIKMANLVYGAHEPEEMFQIDDLWLSLAIDEELTQQHGLIILVDMEGFPWKFLRYFTPHIVGVSTSKAELMPLRHIQYHVINAGLLLNTIIQLVFPFLSQATKESVYFHKTKESLQEHISPSALPKDYGGQVTVDPPALVRSFLDARSSRLKELLSYGYIDKNGTVEAEQG